ncbi:MAG: hypothetical protein R3E91_02805 [Chlamydiales bacterium]
MFSVKKISLLFLLLQQTIFADSLPNIYPQAEELLIRRIAYFCHHQDYPFVKSQIQTYMNTYPNGLFTDYLYEILGDIAMNTKAYQAALDYYHCISNQSDRNLQVLKKEWKALYHLEFYAQLYQKTTPISFQKMDEEGLFYLAEATFHEALHLMDFKEGEQEAKLLYQEALLVYSRLASSKTFGTYAKLAIAEIYHHLGQSKVAADLYLDIAESEQNHEEWLFQAAILLMDNEEKFAADVFERIISTNSSIAGEAALQWLEILIKRGELDKVQLQRELWFSKIEKKDHPHLHFYLGMVAFKQRNYFQAIPDLKAALNYNLSKENHQLALKALFISGAELTDLELCDSIYALLNACYPEKEIETKYIQALAYKRAGKITKAMELFEHFIRICSIDSLLEKAKIEKIHLLAAEKKWDLVHENIKKFLSDYPQSKRKKELLCLAIQFTQSQIQESGNRFYPQLIQYLEQAFVAEIFDEKELSQKKLLLIQAHIQLNHIPIALTLLNEIDDPDPLLLTQCYIKEGVKQQILFFGEKALEQHPDHDYLHLHLFNTYLELAKETPEKYLIEQAARHLNAVIQIYPVTLENRLWLAHYFALIGDLRFVDLLESILETEENWKKFDEEGIMLARFYQKKGEWQKAWLLAEKIIFLGDKMKGEAQLVMAQILLGLGKEEKAIEIFCHLENDPNPKTAYQATLSLAEVYFPNKPEKSLNKLQYLIRNKAPATEPIHLEAALKRAEFLAALSPKKTQMKCFLDALLEIKEEFAIRQSTKDSDQTLQLSPRQEDIYRSYMRYLDLYIDKLQVKIERDLHHKKDKKHLMKLSVSKQEEEDSQLSPLLDHSTIADFLQTTYEIENRSESLLCQLSPEPIPLNCSFLETIPISDPMTQTLNFEIDWPLYPFQPILTIQYPRLFKIPTIDPIEMIPLTYLGIKEPSFRIPCSDDFEIIVEYIPKRYRPGYVFKVIFYPRSEATFHHIQQNISFLIDRSYSTHRIHYNSNKKAVSEALNHLREGDMFNITFFDNHIAKFAPQPIPWNQKNIAEARLFLDREKHGNYFGRTELYASLEKIIPQDLRKDQIHTAILFSDGETYLSREMQRQILRKWMVHNQGKVCIYNIASGKRNHLPLLDLLSSFNQGHLVYSPNKNDISPMLNHLLHTIDCPIGQDMVATPVTSDKQISILLQPKTGYLPNLYHHSPFVIYGSINRLSDFILFLQGKSSEENFEIKKTISFEQAKMSAFPLEKKWIQLLTHEYYARYLQDGNLKHLEAAKQILHPMNISTLWID